MGHMIAERSKIDSDAFKSDSEGTLDGWIAEAEEVFGNGGIGLAFGFIDSTHNVPLNDYGWSSLYHPLSLIKPYRHIPCINALKHHSSRRSRLDAFELNLVDEFDVYAWFYDLVFRQNNESLKLTDKDGKTYLGESYGRWSKRKPSGYQVRKRLRGILEVIENPLLLSLTTYQPKVEAAMPFNTNLDAVMFAILNIGGWVREFLRKLRKYQEYRGIEWRYLGWVLEFQENGFPHVHILMAGDWIGNIQEVAALWAWSEPQGVDYMNRSKLKKKFGSRKTDDPLRLANYLTAYVAQGRAAVVNPGDNIGKGKKMKAWNSETSIHKGFAFLAFFGGRIYNLAHEKKGG